MSLDDTHALYLFYLYIKQNFPLPSTLFVKKVKGHEQGHGQETVLHPHIKIQKRSMDFEELEYHEY